MPSAWLKALTAGADSPSALRLKPRFVQRRACSDAPVPPLGLARDGSPWNQGNVVRMLAGRNQDVAHVDG